MELTDKLKKLLSLTRRSVQDYDMIQDGDRVCVGLSGGKDSSAMLAVLAYLKRFYPKKFELEAVHISLGFANKEETREALQKYCDSLGVHFTFVESSIAEVVFDIRKESNPCALCANLRRGALNDHAARLGCNVVALAQRTAIQNAYCGMTGRQLDSFAREIIVANGMGQYFTHSTGHSLGIDIHEFPSASAVDWCKYGSNVVSSVPLALTLFSKI